VTKSVASALVGLAVAEGSVDSIDAPIDRWLPDLRDARARGLTIAHLLEMRSVSGFGKACFPGVTNRKRITPPICGDAC